MVDEALFPRRINSDLVQGQRCLVPARTVLTGRDIRLEPLDPERHAPALYQAGHGSEAARSSWDRRPAILADPSDRGESRDRQRPAVAGTHHFVNDGSGRGEEAVEQHSRRAIDLPTGRRDSYRASRAVGRTLVGYEK
jgi:hypothetical protein